MKTLFLQTPSYDGFDGGAGARYQARREIRSYWYPTWLAQLAAMVPDSKLIDAAPHGIGGDEVMTEATQYDLAVLHSSTPTFASDVKNAARLKQAKPGIKVGMVGANIAVDPRAALEKAAAVDFVTGKDYDFTVRDVAEGRDFAAIPGLIYRDKNGVIQQNEARPMLENMDELPFVTPVYKRDLKIENYFIGYLKHPYISFYTGRGCKSRCTFCLWPQTIGGHKYRTRSVDNVVEEIAWAKKAMPQVKEFFFDDDTFTDDLPRAEAIARALGKMGVEWSCNAKANVPRESLKVMRDQRPAPFAGRLRVRQSADPAQHQEGHAHRRGKALHQGLPRARRHHPRHLHHGPAGRDQRDHPGDHQLRQRHQSAHAAGVAGGALSGHVPL